MSSTYQSLTTVPDPTRVRPAGLSEPATIRAYVQRRITDPALLSGSGPRYADFFRPAR